MTHDALPPIVVVGELNPHGSDPSYALYHEPENSAGGRLCRRIMGLRVVSYHRYTRRFNLCTGTWNAARATAEALRIETEVAGTAIVLLGRKVAEAFGVGATSPYSRLLSRRVPDRETPLLLLPHPSGRNREWNDPASYQRARVLLALERPDIPWGNVSVAPVVTVTCTNCGLVTISNICPDCGFDEGGGNRNYA